MLIETIVLAIVTGLILKGKISNIGSVKFNWVFLIFSALIIRNIPSVLNFKFLEKYAYIVPYIAPLFFVLSYAFIILALVSNLHYKSMYLILGGTVMNTAVVVANGGYMPVLLSGLIRGGYNLESVTNSLLDMNHILSSESSNLMFLGDIVLIPPPYPFPQMLSAGDILMNIGLFIFIVSAMKNKPSKQI